MSRDITQGTRRGAWAGYLEITHGDFWEVISHLEHNPQDLNLGWIIPDSFINDLQNNDPEALLRYKRALKIKLQTGKGYFVFLDRANRNAPVAMRDQGLTIRASNLCSEIMLHSDQDHSFTCILSSMNAARYGEWAENAVFNATVFLDCVCSEFLQRAKKIRGLEKTVRYTEKARSVGLGMLGFHTLLQMRNYPLDSIDTVYLNSELFQELNTESLRASQWLAAELGEPEFCKGYGVRNLNRCAIAPNTSSAVIAGSVSPGIEPIFANAFLQPIAGGEVNRVNPVLIEVMKEQGRYNTKSINRILLNEGSVQDEDWLTDHQKRVFLTAFEVDQMTIIRLASQRQKSLDQGQSLNLFFAAGTAEEYISKVHQAAFLDDEILGLYYIRSNSSNKASTGEVACESCASLLIIDDNKMFTYNVKLDRVVDGDTVDFIVDLGFGISVKERFRLFGINAPEARTKHLVEKKKGMASKAFLHDLLTKAEEEGKQIQIITYRDRKGKFGRYLGSIYVDLKNINHLMMDENHAEPYP